MQSSESIFFRGKKSFFFLPSPALLFTRWISCLSRARERERASHSKTLLRGISRNFMDCFSLQNIYCVSPNFPAYKRLAQKPKWEREVCLYKIGCEWTIEPYARQIRLLFEYGSAVMRKVRINLITKVELLNKSVLWIDQKYFKYADR